MFTVTFILKSCLPEITNRIIRARNEKLMLCTCIHVCFHITPKDVFNLLLYYIIIQ
uniref:Uncharacterized protein n=1 Tax=Anguilla anguilla TaxID=7936 RepID=A0A0E9WB47_ANGAN